MPKNSEAGNSEVRSERIAGNSRAGNATSELEWTRSADRNCLFICELERFHGEQKQVGWNN